MRDWIIAIIILGFILLAFVEPIVKALHGPVVANDAAFMVD